MPLHGVGQFSTYIILNVTREFKEKTMSEFPAELKYASSHEWARVESDGSVVIGITDHAQDALGDVVYIELPEMGASVDAGSEVAVIESVKAASDIYSPVTGEVIEINPALEDEPETVNSSPYADGWLFRVMPSDMAGIDDLMDADSYAATVEE
jgi:glycine cleavage system H protein